MRGKVLSTLAYPIILAIVAAFVVFALMIFVVPKVVEQFEDVGQQLPLLTRMVIGLSSFLSNWWWALLILIALAVFAGGRALREEGLRMKFDGLLLRLPLIGRLIRDLHAARMARTLSTMVASRLPLLEGLEADHRDGPQPGAARRLGEHRRDGPHRRQPVGRAAQGRRVPALARLSCRLGRGVRAGSTLMLERAADYLEREFDAFTSTALSLLEPAIIIVMGVIVALIVLSILLPILQLDTLAGGY